MTIGTNISNLPQQTMINQSQAAQEPQKEAPKAEPIEYASNFKLKSIEFIKGDDDKTVSANATYTYKCEGEEKEVTHTFTEGKKKGWGDINKTKIAMDKIVSQVELLLNSIPSTKLTAEEFDHHVNSFTTGNFRTKSSKTVDSDSHKHKEFVDIGGILKVVVKLVDLQKKINGLQAGPERDMLQKEYDKLLKDPVLKTVVIKKDGLFFFNTVEKTGEKGKYTLYRLTPSDDTKADRVKLRSIAKNYVKGTGEFKLNIDESKQSEKKTNLVSLDEVLKAFKLKDIENAKEIDKSQAEKDLALLRDYYEGDLSVDKIEESNRLIDDHSRIEELREYLSKGLKKGSLDGQQKELLKKNLRYVVRSITPERVILNYFESINYEIKDEGLAGDIKAALKIDEELTADRVKKISTEEVRTITEYIIKKTNNGW